VEAGQGWRAACAAFVQESGLDPSVLRRLDAFGRPGDDPLPGRDFLALEREATHDVAALDTEIGSRLAVEVDAAQAAMFGRRRADVAAMLASLSPLHAEARVLRIGLWRRIRDVLAAEGPRALRIRAVVDFYYSMGAQLRHRGIPGPTLASRIAALRWSEVAPGVRHALLDGRTDEGPLHVNLLRVAPGCSLRAADAREVGDFAEWTTASGACAATSGGFFLYSEPAIAAPSARHDPVGLLADGRHVLSPPSVGRSALVQEADGRFVIRRIGPSDAHLVPDTGPRFDIVARNTAAPPWTGDGPVGVAAHDRAHGPTRAGHAGGWLSVVGEHARALPPGPAAVPLNGVLLALPLGAPAHSGRVRWVLDTPVRAAIAGGPRLLDAGRIDLDRAKDDLVGDAPPITFSQDETFDQNLLPRMAVGQLPDGGLLFAAIDGRNIDTAPGFTLAGSAALLRTLGCTEALNLDGGSSKRMVVDGRVVDLPTTEVVRGERSSARVRPVHTALLVFSAPA
jgi:hypothetical protein